MYEEGKNTRLSERKVTGGQFVDKLKMQLVMRVGHDKDWIS